MVVLPRRTYDLRQYMFLHCFYLYFRQAVWKDMVVGRGTLFVLKSVFTHILRLYLQPSPTEFAVLHYVAELLVHGCLGTQIPSGLCRLGLAVAMTNLRLRSCHMPTLRGCRLLSCLSAVAVSGNLFLGTLAFFQPSFPPSPGSSSTAQHNEHFLSEQRKLTRHFFWIATLKTPTRTWTWGSRQQLEMSTAKKPT